jgi:hypothetical protein
LGGRTREASRRSCSSVMAAIVLNSVAKKEAGLETRPVCAG